MNIVISLQNAAVISPQSFHHVHHILVYLCAGVNLTGHPDVGVNHECDGISEEIRPCKFSTVIAVWAIGGNVSNHNIKEFFKYAHIYMHEYHNYFCTIRSYIHVVICVAIATWFYISTQNFTYPEGIALPIGGEDKIHTHVMIEMHYDNPQELTG